jgi:hypothetical protein
MVYPEAHKIEYVLNDHVHGMVLFEPPWINKLVSDELAYIGGVANLLDAGSQLCR